MRQESTTSKKSTAHIFLICLLLLGIPAGACIYKGDLVTGIALATVGLSCYLGYLTGAIGASASAGGIVAAVYFAPQWAPLLEPVLAERLFLSGLLNRGVALTLVGLAVIVIGFLIGKLVCRLLLPKDGRGPVNGLNQWGGLMIMGGEAVVGIALLLGGILIISPEQADVPISTATATLQERLNYQIDVVAAETRSGALGNILKKHNPFVKFPQLNKFKEIQQTFRTVGNPAAMKQVLTHPRIKELQNNPAVHAAIAKLEADQVVQEIIESGGPLDRGKLMGILNSQAVAELLSEPEFLVQASAIMNELNQSGGEPTAMENSIR